MGSVIWCQILPLMLEWRYRHRQGRGLWTVVIQSYVALVYHFNCLNPFPPFDKLWCLSGGFASEITYIVSGGALYATHSLTCLEVKKEYYQNCLLNYCCCDC